MAKSLTSAGGLWRTLLWSAGAVVVTAGVLFVYSASLHNTAFLSGWILLGLMLFLAVYNLRKKLTYPPLRSSSAWLRSHLVVGFLSIVLFLLHTGLRFPDGPLEGALAALYVGLAASGILGLFLSRTVPPRLAVREEEVLFERIPRFRRELREQAEQLVVSCAEEFHTPTLADFYKDRLADFFAGPRNFWRHVYQSGRPLHRLMTDLGSLDRYFNDQEHRIAGDLAELIKAKDNLDYHHAMQGLLKGWLFVHIPLTYALLLLVAVHAWLAHAFFAGIR